MDHETRQAAYELLVARARITRALRLEEECVGVPVAALTYAAGEARRIADLLEVMLCG